MVQPFKSRLQFSLMTINRLILKWAWQFLIYSIQSTDTISANQQKNQPTLERHKTSSCRVEIWGEDSPQTRFASSTFVRKETAKSITKVREIILSMRQLRSLLYVSRTHYIRLAHNHEKYFLSIHGSSLYLDETHSKIGLKKKDVLIMGAQ